MLIPPGPDFSADGEIDLGTFEEGGAYSDTIFHLKKADKDLEPSLEQVADDPNVSMSKVEGGTPKRSKYLTPDIICSVGRIRHMGARNALAGTLSLLNPVLSVSSLSRIT